MRFGFDLNEESVMVQQTGRERPGGEVRDAFGIKESDLHDRFALGSAAPA